MSNTTTKPVWPAAEFDSWPVTRTGAILVDSVILAVVIVWTLLCCRRFIRPERTDSFQCLYKRWGFWPCGLHKITKTDGNLVVKKMKCWLFCMDETILIPSANVTSVQVCRHDLLWFGPLWACLSACLFGMWLHFIPCIWWTCDWGPHDGQGVRGGIWFSVWPIMTIVLCILEKTAAVKITYWANNTRTQSNSVILSIASGNTYCIDTANLASNVKRDHTLIEDLVHNETAGNNDIQTNDYKTF